MLQPYLALSRSTHGVLDIALPAFAALLWLGAFPSGQVIALALLTGFAGYTAIYALNDLVGLEADREKFTDGELNEGYSVEASALRYPLARRLLGVRNGLAWFGFWYALTLVGAWLLNPWLLIVVIAAPLLEALYCRLLKIGWWRVFVSGLVKSLGPIGAVLVVVPRPDPALLTLMVVWVMCWEIGGQNIPADWNDVEEDRRIGARTIPVTFGPQTAGRLVVIALILTVALSLLLPAMSPLDLGWPYLLLSLIVGVVLLLLPGLRLLRSGDGRLAARLFDRASLYPLAMLLIALGFVLLRDLGIG